MTKLEIGDKQFSMVGQPFRIVAGAIHYFRVVPEYWRDRLQKLKACGFNTVETYVAWNMHEPKEGVFHFEGMADLVRFIETAQELGLFVIVRPSPYICAEWEFGGLPAWLLRYPDIRLRCADPVFLQKVDAYYDVLIPKLIPLLSTNGGTVIALQIENEYGSYGNDKAYLEHLRQGLIARGVDVPLFTSDGPTDSMLQGGTLPDVLATVNFGSKPEEMFEKFKEYRPTEPLVCMEYWNGWFDHWTEKHHTRDADDVADVLDRMLNLGASVNFYMFHGGTNFGFYNGANYGDAYEPTITSYDYDAPLSESGDITPKFHAVRQILAKHMDIGECELPEPIAKKQYGLVRLTEKADLFSNLPQLSTPLTSTYPVPMEQVGQDFGFILYSTNVTGPRLNMQLHLQDVHDRAIVFVDGSYLGTVERWAPQSLKLDIPVGGAKLDILVENMGRVNYGPKLKDSKGITEGVRLNGQFLFDWTISPLPLDNVSSLQFLPFKDTPNENPAFYKGSIEIEEIADTFIRLDGWKKGVVWVNGFNLGRYWERGPQKTLYVPGPLLRKGSNEIIVFELHDVINPEIMLVDTPDLG
ncbi:glycoside hydrolase family 35 protein [Paenibacillus aceris]|uniref:Beta-galactosidase n=1 Tax=Paenibacillus aceris TaxID=869555 RepID=A0ABS4I935_9BACL|nr:beta-galactosidase family protein [Paenibacillus aceris]MBP1966579.1 beta-galactosidase [Paenibacillus aceris]NHW38816.1 beta-galactosidase [Paenibacillus aceris]